MQRPRSEGRLSSPPHASRPPNSGRQRRTGNALSQSVDATPSPRRSASSSSDDEDIDVRDATDILGGSMDGYITTDRALNARGGHPRRPRSTPQKARVQRYVLGPGQSHVQEAQRQRDIFMTHLPDSPPRLYGSTSGSTSPEISAPRASIFSFSSAHARGNVEVVTEVAPPSPVEDQPGSAYESINHARSDDQLQNESKTSRQRDDEEERDSELHDEEVQVESSQGCEDDSDDEAVDRDDSGLFAHAAVDSSGSEECPETEQSTDRADFSATGPNAADLEIPSSVSVDKVVNAPTDPDFDVDPFAVPLQEEQREDEDEYARLQQARLRLEADEQRRDVVRQELESYVSSLTSRRDEDGAKWIEFPKNYQQILSLMTERDVRDDDLPASSSTRAQTTAHSERQKSWSEILIQNSLSKQHAYGELDESEDGSSSERGLAAKIALKMARVRQLDAVLEEKLGKNLYTDPVPTKKAKKKSAGDEENGQSARTKTFVTQPNSITNDGSAGSSSTSRPSATHRRPTSTTTTTTTTTSIQASSGQMNFIERNKQVVENGAKANLTRDEEERLRRLLRETDDQQQEADSTPTSVEFVLDVSEKNEIERMIADKRGVYQSAVILALEDIGEEDPANPGSPEAGSSKARKPNIVQDTKKERMRRQRLLRIEEELQFLHENEIVPILPDEDDDASDGSMSERSYMTTTSMASTCSTRSGVTRRQFDQFVAAEVSKSENSCAIASSDDIQRLLRSLSHVSVSRPTTTSV